MGQSVNASGIAQAVPNTDNMDSVAGLPKIIGEFLFVRRAYVA